MFFFIQQAIHTVTYIAFPLKINHGAYSILVHFEFPIPFNGFILFHYITIFYLFSSLLDIDVITNLLH